MNHFAYSVALAVVLFIFPTVGCGRVGKTTNRTRTDRESSSSLSSSSVVARPKSRGTRFRAATYNVSLYRDQSGQLAEDLAGGSDAQAHRVAEVIQLIRPDVLLLNEFDYDDNHEAVKSFREGYLGVQHGSARAIQYPYFYTNPVNTGVPSSLDFDNDGEVNGPNDCFGFGRHPGQYGMLVLSKFAIDTGGSRTFQELLWADMPGALLPIDPHTNASFYSEETLKVFRLSSKSHWDVLIDIGGANLHFLVCHPTPPVFDGPEDRNGNRNHDEIRLIADYVSPERSDYIVDDGGRRGGLVPGSHFVIAGDLNADPHDGDSSANAMRQLLEHSLVEAVPVPSSDGAREAATSGANAMHINSPAHDTANFGAAGNLRVDYVLPSKTMRVIESGVFWPKKSSAHHDLIDASDHRMVWVDLEITSP